MISDTDTLLPFLIVSIRSIYGVAVTLDFLPEISLKYTIVINSDAMVGVSGLPRFSPNRCDLLYMAKPLEARDERRVCS